MILLVFLFLPLFFPPPAVPVLFTAILEQLFFLEYLTPLFSTMNRTFFFSFFLFFYGWDDQFF